MGFHCPDVGRVLTGPYGSPKGTRAHGAFFVRPPGSAHRTAPPLKIIASDGADPDDPTGWEHVSVSLPHRCPTWAEMCFVRDLFWDDGDVVIQIHPARAEYVDLHPFCLHLWRPADGVIPLPPRRLV